MSPLALFTGPYATLAKWGVIALLVVSFGAFSWVKGNAHGTQKLLNYQGKQIVEASRISAARERVTEKVVVKYVKVKGDNKIVTDTVEKEVIKYANPGYCLDPSWRVLHDAAAANAVPPAGFQLDGALRTTPVPIGLRSPNSQPSTKDGDTELRAAPSLR